MLDLRHKAAVRRFECPAVSGFDGMFCFCGNKRLKGDDGSVFKERIIKRVIVI